MLVDEAVSVVASRRFWATAPAPITRSWASARVWSSISDKSLKSLSLAMVIGTSSASARSSSSASSRLGTNSAPFRDTEEATCVMLNISYSLYSTNKNKQHELIINESRSAVLSEIKINQVNYGLQ